MADQVHSSRAQGSPRRSEADPVRKRVGRFWVIAAASAACCLAYLVASGSLIGRAALLLALAVLALALISVLRVLGIGLDHRFFRHIASRPWRDGREVLRRALRRLSEVFVTSATGSLLAPTAVELRMNPADVRSLADVIEIPVVNTFATEAYAAEIAAHSAQVPPDTPVAVSVVEDVAVARGRFRISQRKISGLRASAGLPAAHRHHHDLGQNPLLRLVTRGTVTETRTSGASAGRTRSADLLLPDEPTISRVHARFMCVDRVWRIAGLGRNGVVVNGSVLSGEQQRVIRDGDVIRWGRQSGALVSKVEILR